MFVEPLLNRRPGSPPQGWIEVICGSMFSGKTEELIRRINRVLIAGRAVQVIKPAIDTRYHPERVVSHQHNHFTAIPVERATDILPLAKGFDTLAIDEGQFFDDALPDICNQLANRGIRVIVAGLDKDYEGQPFPPMPALMSIAEFVTKVHAVCVHCGSIAAFSHRLSSESDPILLGAQHQYEPLCRMCYQQARETKPNEKATYKEHPFTTQ
ncbi:MAG: thymidine kinase [Bernardetiaceae bacterium]